MAEDTLEQAIIVGELGESECQTKNIQIHGFHQHSDIFDDLSIYGSDAIEIKNLVRSDNNLGDKILSTENLIKAEVVWATREEMAINISDFLLRRRRMLLLDAKTSIEMAPIVAELMMKELDKNEDWKKDQINSFKKLAQNYLVV